VARALAGRSERPYVFTKCELVWNDKREISRCLRPIPSGASAKNNLRRLKVETIDLYQIHWPEPGEDIEEGWGTLAKLKDEGKLRWIGVSNFDVQQMERCRGIAPITLAATTLLGDPRRKSKPRFCPIARSTGSA